MKRKMVFLILAVSVLLGGCDWMDGSYVHVTQHRQQSSSVNSAVVSAADYAQLYGVLVDMIASGTESGIINVSEYDQKMVENSMRVAVHQAKEVYPVGAYAVEQINYELGSNSGRPAIAVTIDYLRSRIEIQRIQAVADMAAAEVAVTEALEDCDAGVVLQIDRYEETDFMQLVQDYGRIYPERIMEIPQVASAIYGFGDSRVVELTFTYQTSRDSLRSMKTKVQPVFESAALYVSAESADSQKYTQLYAFLMERFDYTIETSITPAYSLLHYGVGDSHAFATVYAAMCRMAGLEALTVTGTRDGAPWTWNIIRDNGNYFHVDLIRCNVQGGFREFTDGEMAGYVWDYSAYPECPPVFFPVEETEPEQPQETKPQPTEAPEIVETTEPVETEETVENTQPEEATTAPTEIFE